jgi:hypothetical protein
MFINYFGVDIDTLEGKLLMLFGMLLTLFIFFGSFSLLHMIYLVQQAYELAVMDEEELEIEIFVQRQ